jgi:hemolysin III
MSSINPTMPLDSSPVKPKLRGVSHQIAAFVALAAGAILVLIAPSAKAAGIAAIYVLSLVGMFTISAAYHRPNWSPKARQWMRRLDHAGIFLLIAGTYTPLGVLLMPHVGRTALVIAWTGAIIGILKSLFWVGAPKVLNAILFLALGWTSVLFLPHMFRMGGWSLVGLFAGGGLLYSVGAVIYALKRPDPFPATFGYHEIFHALVILAAGCHFAAEVFVVRHLN